MLQHLRSIGKKTANAKIDTLPFNIPPIKNFEEIEFNKPVTFVVGENGLGKLTILDINCQVMLHLRK